MGLAPGDRAGIWATNCVEWLLLQFGAARAGVVLVNVNPAYRSHELGFVLEQSRIRALFLRDWDARADYRDDPGGMRRRRSMWCGSVSRRGTRCWPRRSLGPRRASRPTDVVNIQYTSGTTGRRRVCC